MYAYAFTCDACGTVADVTPSRDYMGVRYPDGWRHIDGRDFCSLMCLAVYANNPDAVAKPEYAPSLFDDLGKRIAERSKAPAGTEV